MYVLVGMATPLLQWQQCYIHLLVHPVH